MALKTEIKDNIENTTMPIINNRNYDESDNNSFLFPQDDEGNSYEENLHKITGETKLTQDRSFHRSHGVFIKHNEPLVYDDNIKFLEITNKQLQTNKKSLKKNSLVMKNLLKKFEDLKDAVE